MAGRSFREESSYELPETNPIGPFVLTAFNASLKKKSQDQAAKRAAALKVKQFNIETGGWETVGDNIILKRGGISATRNYHKVMADPDATAEDRENSMKMIDAVGDANERAKTREARYNTYKDDIIPKMPVWYDKNGWNDYVIKASMVKEGETDLSVINPDTVISPHDDFDTNVVDRFLSRMAVAEWLKTEGTVSQTTGSDSPLGADPETTISRDRSLKSKLLKQAEKLGGIGKVVIEGKDLDNFFDTIDNSEHYYTTLAENELKDAAQQYHDNNPNAPGDVETTYADMLDNPEKYGVASVGARVYEKASADIKRQLQREESYSYQKKVKEPEEKSKLSPKAAGIGNKLRISEGVIDKGVMIQVPAKTGTMGPPTEKGVYGFGANDVINIPKNHVFVGINDISTKNKNKPIELSSQQPIVYPINGGSGYVLDKAETIVSKQLAVVLKSKDSSYTKLIPAESEEEVYEYLRNMTDEEKAKVTPEFMFLAKISTKTTDLGKSDILRANPDNQSIFKKFDEAMDKDNITDAEQVAAYAELEADLGYTPLNKLASTYTTDLLIPYGSEEKAQVSHMNDEDFDPQQTETGRKVAEAFLGKLDLNMKVDLPNGETVTVQQLLDDGKTMEEIQAAFK